MLKLYKIRFRWKNSGAPMQPIIASAPNGTEAKRRARLFVASQYPEPFTLDEAPEVICRTPDDVLDWS